MASGGGAVTALTIPPDLRVTTPEGAIPAAHVLALPNRLEAIYDGHILFGGLHGLDIAGCAFVFGVGWHTSMAGRGYEDTCHMAAVLGARLAGQNPDWPSGEAHVRGLPVVDTRFEFAVTPGWLPVVEHKAVDMAAALEVVRDNVSGSAREYILEMAEQARACESGQCSCGGNGG